MTGAAPPLTENGVKKPHKSPLILRLIMLLTHKLVSVFFIQIQFRDQLLGLQTGAHLLQEMCK